MELGEKLFKNLNNLYSKSQIARTLGFARGCFYYKSKLEIKDKNLANQIEDLHDNKDDTLGHKKLAKILSTGKGRVRRVMKKYGIVARKKKKKYDYPGKTNNIFPNIAGNVDEAGRYKDILFSDIFEFKLADNTKVRGCFILRKSTRQILSIVFDYSMHASLVVEAIDKSKITILDANTLLWHSDQGKQYGAEITVEVLTQFKLTLSMSRAGTPTDNAFAERFVGIFKLAVVEKRKYNTLGDFLKEAEKWINFYNNGRPHEGIDMMTPNKFAEKNNIKTVPLISLF